jgi:hypothetical protein
MRTPDRKLHPVHLDERYIVGLYRRFDVFTRRFAPIFQRTCDTRHARISRIPPLAFCGM